MSRSTNYTFTCPCGEVFTSQIYEYINVAQDPQLRYTVLAGLSNVATCPVCGRRAAFSRPFIYSDLAHNLLAYVHPRADAPEEARMFIKEKLRGVYTNISAPLEICGQEEEAAFHPTNDAITCHYPSLPLPRRGCREGADRVASSFAQGAWKEKEMPPLRIVFGLDQLNELINASLNQDERLGRLALSTQSRSDAERGLLLTIARKLASEMKCQVEVEDLPDEYTVWLYGSRRQIGALMRELAPRG